VRKLEINGITENAGEFRGGKCLSTIWGVHENGNVYSRVNDVAPIKFAFGDIQWPTGWKCIEPKNNFKFNGNGNHNLGRPSSGKYKGRRIDWDKYNEALKNGSGSDIIESLVERWFSDAIGDLSDETITIEDVFEGILEDTGEDFFKAATGLRSTTFGMSNRKRSSSGALPTTRGHRFQAPC